MKVIGLDWAENRLTLSLKAMQDDPWESKADKYSVEDRVKGVVVRLAPFGAFVNLEPEFDGLIHISRLGQVATSIIPKKWWRSARWSSLSFYRWTRRTERFPSPSKSGHRRTHRFPKWVR